MVDSPQIVCSVCGHEAERFATTPSGRENASCTVCGSLERHRFLVLLLTSTVAERAHLGTVLDVAPSWQIRPLLRRLNPDHYVSIDFDPDADGRLVDVVASLTDLPFADDSVGLMVCYHVLEHVPDDRRAMAEIARVLRPDGLALVQVPWRPRELTDEDPDAPPAERVRRFGQADHVRYYGSDFVTRMQESGLVLREVTPADLVDEQMRALMGLLGFESLWLCATDEKVLPEIADLRNQLQRWTGVQMARSVARTRGGELDGVHQSDVDQAAAKLTKARANAANWKFRYERLAGRRPVRAMVWVSRRFRRSAGG